MSETFDATLVKQETHHGREVWAHVWTERLRKTHCLCLNCTKFRPSKKDHCPKAQQAYNVAKRYKLAFMVTRCPTWDPERIKLGKAQDKASFAALGTLPEPGHETVRLTDGERVLFVAHKGNVALWSRPGTANGNMALAAFLTNHRPLQGDEVPTITPEAVLAEADELLRISGVPKPTIQVDGKGEPDVAAVEAVMDEAQQNAALAKRLGAEPVPSAEKDEVE